MSSSQASPQPSPPPPLPIDLDRSLDLRPTTSASTSITANILNHHPNPNLEAKSPTSPALQSAAASLAISRSLSEDSIASAAEQSNLVAAAISMSRQSTDSFQSSRTSDSSFQSLSSSSSGASRLSTSSLDSSAEDSQNDPDGTEPFPTTTGGQEDVDPDATMNAGNGGRKTKRRGYMRPQGTNFAASARHRESVLSLGSIAHIQFYFARTGLLDGKGAQFARKNRNQRATIDISGLVSPLRSPSLEAIDADGAKTRHLSLMFGGSDQPQVSYLDDSCFTRHDPGRRSDSDDEADTTQDTSTLYSEDPDEFDDEEYDEAAMLPPTTSTFRATEKHIAPPPTIKELKRDLRHALNAATTALEDVLAYKMGATPRKESVTSTSNAQAETQGWFEVQGMHILDVMTMAIRAAKVYYTAHEHPERLDSIKPEREVRTELLSVLECLRQMASREFKGGIRETELGALAGWIASVSAMLRGDEQLEAAEREERLSWKWLHGNWAGREVERELAFLASMHPEAAASLPEYTPLSDDLSSMVLPTPFLAAFQNGLLLVQLHNAAVRKSKRRFGAIAAYHRDTQKPYRAADNIRYWAKAAELRWEVPLRVDALAVVYNSEPQAWRHFHDAIFDWCQSVREEITAELADELDGLC
ncbi:hypothetical protein CFO_g204 [Ceratocystis platani]|uniref:Uncharacterized protein n=1 Tax=Ceratocystis fimbriata f. sp. platani TaxID=88771 RepID=A0A0F8D409_CERFI|nr:hypothetical protein CFO_g204 [Ceratocystis platani]